MARGSFEHNPQGMCEGYGVHSVCVSVCYHVSCYILRLYVDLKIRCHRVLQRFNVRVRVKPAHEVIFILSLCGFGTCHGR